jgi:hypothetical protein
MLRAGPCVARGRDDIHIDAEHELAEPEQSMPMSVCGATPDAGST